LNKTLFERKATLASGPMIDVVGFQKICGVQMPLAGPEKPDSATYLR
jgi:hypothetical protein